MNRHRKFVAQATIQMPGRLTKREKNEDEWEKTPFQQFKANFATLLPAGPNTESYASIIVDILSFFWLYGVPWVSFISVLAMTAQPVSNFHIFHLFYYSFLQLGSISPWIPFDFYQMVLIVGAITYPIFFYDRYHYNRIQKKKITKMAEEWLEVEKDQ